MSETLERADRGDAGQERLLRILTPMLKGYAAERARVVATEAMEVRGGNGYIEDWPNGRILRDVYVHAIWEGSGNIMALDVLRALAKGNGPAYFDEVERLCESTAGSTGPQPPWRAPCWRCRACARTSTPSPALASTRPSCGCGGWSGAWPSPTWQRCWPPRRRSTTPTPAAAAWPTSRRASRHDSRARGRGGGRDDAAWLKDFDGIAHGGHVAPETGRRAATAVASALAWRNPRHDLDSLLQARRAGAVPGPSGRS